MRRFPDAKESPIGLLQKYLYHKIKDECYLRNLSDEMHEVIKMSIEMLDKNFETIIDKFTDLGDFLESLE